MSMNTPSSSKSSGTTIGLVAFICIISAIVWIGALLWQTTTSEAQVFHAGVGSIMGIQGALNQWSAFVQGRLSPMQDAAFIYAWGIEVFVLIGTTLFAVALATIGRGHPMIIKMFEVMLIVCFLLDFGSDFNFLPSELGLPARALISLLIAAAVAFLGAVAFGCAEYCVKHW